MCRVRIATGLLISVLVVLLSAVGGSSWAAGIGTVQSATTDASGNLVDITYDVQGNPETSKAADLIGSTLVLSTLTGTPGAPGSGDANRFWTLNGAPAPTEAQALRSVGDKYLGTALQDCSSTSQHDTLFDQPIIPGPGPEIFVVHGGLNDDFVVLDAAGLPALTILNDPGNFVPIPVSTLFKAWYLQSNVVYGVVGTFSHTDSQDRIVALDLDPSDVASIGGLRFAGGPCDYVYEILGRDPNQDRDLPFASPEIIPRDTSAGDLAIAADLDGDGDLDTVIAPGPGSTAPEIVWLENDGGPSSTWTRRQISTPNVWISAGSADVDGDGDVDVFAATATDVAWFDNDGASPPSWTERGISSGEILVSSVEVADLGQDGDLDMLVATGGNAGEVLWFESNGAAIPGWTRQVVIDGSDFSTATAADLDSDGDLDVLLAGAQDTGGTPGLVQTIRNDGSWTPLTAVLPPNRVRSLAVGDIDGDGDIDAAIAAPELGGGGNATLLWLDNDGGGLWSSNDAANPDQPVDVELLDLNMDGDLDPLYGTAGAGTAAWLPNITGLGSFGPARDIAFGNLADVEAGDVDQDGDIDVLASADEIAWIENRMIHRSAVFPVPSVITTTGGGTASSVFAADVDGDGDTDSLTAGADTFAWHENDGASPPSWTPHTISTTGGGTANSVFAADVDGDGDVDAFTAGADTFAWHENNALNVVNPDFELVYKAGSTTVTSPLFPNFAYASGLSHLGMSSPTTVTFSDGSVGSSFDMAGWQWSTSNGVSNVNSAFNPGHKRDMVLIMNGAFFGGGTGPHLVTQVLTASLEQDVTYTLTADFGWRTDNAGPSLPPVLELYAGATLLTPSASSSPALIQGQYVTHSRTYLVSTPSISGPLKIEIGLGANTDGRQLNIDHVTLGKSGATLPSWAPRTIATTGGGTANSAFGADVDGDGDLDALTAGADTFAWHENDGASPPNWTQRTIATTGGGDANAVLAADVDGDGDLDVLTAGAGTIAWHENDGATPPSWTQRTIATTGGGDANAVLAADVDGDGDLDALTAGGGTIAWHENDGATPPSWTPRTITTTGGGTANSVFAADVDNDGDVDALTAWAGTIAWYENDGATPPTWTQSVIATTGGDANSVFAADVDQDGDVDALSAWADTIAWHENRGGQFASTATDCYAGPIREGEEELLASVDLKLNARPGDSPGRVARTRFELRLDSFGPLSEVLDTLRVYRDDGDGELGSADVLLVTVDVATFVGGAGGIYDLQYPVDDPNGIVAAPARFFLTGQVNPSASASVFATLEVANSNGNTTVTDGNAGVVLTEEDDGLNTSCVEVRSIARTLAVNDTGDAADANPGDGSCATAGASCTLRAAISEANASPGPDYIAIPAGTYALTLLGADDTNAAGDLDINDHLTLVGAGADLTIIDGTLGNLRVLDITGAFTVAIRDLTVTGGDTPGPGGGLEVGAGASVEIERCVIEGNTAGSEGGGIAAGAGSFLQLVDSRVVNNVAGGTGGGIHSSQTVNVVWSEISGNSADGGGGLYTSGVLQVLGSTISGNDAGGSSGGGVLAEGTAFVAFSDSTVAQNSASSGGGVSICPACTGNSYSTILADNNGGSSDCSGTLLSTGYNLVKNTSGCTVSPTANSGTDQLNVDPLLGPLGDYGGTTRSHRLLLGSPAIDTGSCVGPSADRDQTGQARPIDDPIAVNLDDGCDIGAYEARLGQTQTPIEIPIRWCGVSGAPSVDNPALVGEITVNDVLRRRHEIASDEIYFPQSGILFRSGGNFIIEDYPVLDAPPPICVESSPGVFDCDAREPGDVMLDLETGDFSEFHELVASCRAAWEALDPNIHGITAVHINRFVDREGFPRDILGVGGRAPFGDAVEQFVAGRVMVVDNAYRLAANPADTNERLFGHEVGHALSLLHGNGIDDDLDQFLDNNDEPADVPRFDGPNLLQYRNGDELSQLQALQMRIHALVAILSTGPDQFGDSIADGEALDEEKDQILQFGYRELLELEKDQILQFEKDQVLQFEKDQVLQFEKDQILQWEKDQVLQFEKDQILQFGSTFTGSEPTDTTTFHVSLAKLPWPASIRPDTRYYFYLDLDSSDITGAYPSDFAIPGDTGVNFPGLNDLLGEPPIGDEAGVDMILEVTLTSECPNNVCSNFADLRAFDFNDTTQIYELVVTLLDLDLTAYNVGLYRDTGGVEPEVDELPLGITIRVTVENSLLFAAGWGFQDGPNGPVPNPIGMEVFSTVECSGNLLNDDLSSSTVDCQCTTCVDCPNYPGCVDGVGTPAVLADSRIELEQVSGVLTFEPPVLPRAVVAPILAEEGQWVTVYVLGLPTDVTGQVEVSLGGVVLGTVSTAQIDANGDVSLTVQLPFGVLGDQTLSSGITGFAPRATTVVTISPSLAFPDNDGDGIPDDSDPDDDNDGVDDIDENNAGTDPLNPFECGDSDSDLCDDCNSGSFAPLDDGPDSDFDGLCDLGDPCPDPLNPDTDGDGVCDAEDPAPLDPFVCGDADSDTCDDCSTAIMIEAQKHTVGGGNSPGSTKEPLADIEVCAYDSGAGSCAQDVCGGTSHHEYTCIATGDGVDGPCTPAACCTTDVNGECAIYVDPGQYLVISDDATKTVLPDPLGVSAGSLSCGDVTTKHLQQIVKANGKKVPGKTTRLTGSELLIIEPEYVIWEETAELYPFIFESVGDWGVTATVTPPEGFVADHEALTTEVNDELEAVQFVITEIGSDLVPTETTFDVTHGKRRIMVRSKVDLFLTPEYARSRGFSVSELRAKRLIREADQVAREPRPDIDENDKTRTQRAWEARMAPARGVEPDRGRKKDK